MNKPKPLINKSEILPPPPPLGRTIKEGVGHFCKHCNSTMSKKIWSRKRTCDNDKCPSHMLSIITDNPISFVEYLNPPLPPSKKEFVTMKEMLLDAEKYDRKGDDLPCMRILEALGESIENYINKPDKE